MTQQHIVFGLMALFGIMSAIALIFIGITAVRTHREIRKVTER